MKRVYYTLVSCIVLMLCVSACEYRENNRKPQESLKTTVTYRKTASPVPTKSPSPTKSQVPTKSQTPKESVTSTKSPVSKRKEKTKISTGKRYKLGDRLTYELPDKLSLRPGKQTDGWLYCLFQDRKSKSSQYIQPLEEYAANSPKDWLAYGGISEIDLSEHFPTYSNDKLTDFNLNWNHSGCSTEGVITGTEEHAVIAQCSFELYTGAGLMMMEEDGIFLSEEQQIAKQWWVIFSKKENPKGYYVFLNSEKYSKKDIIAIARSVRFSKEAFSD